MRAGRLPLLLLAAALLGGCAMKHTLTIDSKPSGAAIWVNGEKQAGTTPVEIPFTHYGYFDVRLEKAGHESVATTLHVATELDGYPLVDLPFDVLGGHKRFRQVVPLPPLPQNTTQAAAEAIAREGRAFRDAARRAAEEAGTPGRQAPEILR